LEFVLARPSKEKEIKERIYAAALDLISKNGFHDSPMSKLSKLADVSVGTFYLYFPSKNQLIMNLFEHVREQMGESILKNYDDTQPLKKRFTALFFNVFDHYLSHPAHFSFMEQFAISSFNRMSMEALSNDASAAMLKFYKDGIASKELKALPVETLFSLTAGPTVSLVKKHYQGVITLSTQMISEVSECVWDAISAKH
jgi:AcrR family transcriptional regulator